MLFCRYPLPMCGRIQHLIFGHKGLALLPFQLADSSVSPDDRTAFIAVQCEQF
jgi:hypothetical protein